MIAQIKEWVFSNLTLILNSVTAILALAAVWLSWCEVSRSNKALVRIKKFSVTVTGEVALLEVCLKNCGIALQAVSMSLDFLGPKKSGNCHLPMKLRDDFGRLQGAFYRGTIGQFTLSTGEREVVQFLRFLQEPKDQQPSVCVWNNGFFVRSFPIYRRFDALRRRWNCLSIRMMFKRRVADGFKGEGVYKFWALPLFGDRPLQFDTFLNVVRRSNAG